MSRCHFKLVTRTKPSYGCPLTPPPLTSPFIAAVVMAELVIHPNLYTIRRRRSLQSVPPLLRADQAEQRYNEAVQAAVEKCAEDTAGRTCYICYGEGDEDEGLVRGCACRGGAGLAHVSCLARQAQVVAERTFDRWHTCGLCEQLYHGVVYCALGWACWKTYVGRPENDTARLNAMNMLGNGLRAADRDEEALSVFEAHLSTMRRTGASEGDMLIAQGNLAITYQKLGRDEPALRMFQDVYSGRKKLHGEEHVHTLLAANNCASILVNLRRFEAAKSLLRKMMPVARRVLGESRELTLSMRVNYAGVLYQDPGATLDKLREAVTTFEEVERIARRVLGGSHPHTTAIEAELQNARAALRASALSSKATEDTCSRLREEVAQLKAENAELRERRTRRRLG